MRQSEIVEELSRRAQRYLGERRLVVDYYRVRRKVAFPWPVAEMPQVTMAIAFENYCLGRLKRLGSRRADRRKLGWAAELTGQCRPPIPLPPRSPLLVAHRWPYRFPRHHPDLPLGHFLRTPDPVAKRNWPWLDEEVARGIRRLPRRRAASTKNAPGWPKTSPNSKPPPKSSPPKTADWVIRNIPARQRHRPRLVARRRNRRSRRRTPPRPRHSPSCPSYLGLLEIVNHRRRRLRRLRPRLHRRPSPPPPCQAPPNPPPPPRPPQGCSGMQPSTSPPPAMSLNLFSNLTEYRTREMTFHACAHAKICQNDPPAQKPLVALFHARLIGSRT